jgi:hypothetical protein
MSAAIIVGTVIGIWLLYTPERPKEPVPHAATQPAPQPSPRSMHLFKLGEIGVVRSSKQLIILAASSENLERMTQLRLANNDQGLAQMVLAGRALMVKSETRCRVIENGSLTYEIRVLDGSCAGRSATVPYDELTQ